jgi:thioredoxin 1
MTVLTATDATFDELVTNSDLPVLVEFGAEWCPPCRAMAPVLDALSDDLDGRLRIVTVDVDESPRLALEHRITGVPIVALVQHGEVVRRLTGGQPRHVLEAAVASLV